MLAAIYGSLTVGSILRFACLRGAEADLRRQRLQSLRTWWILALLLGGGLLAGRPGVCLLLGLASLLAFHEYAVLLGVERTERPAVFAAYGITVVHYLLILFDRAAAFTLFVPFGSLAILALVQLLQGKAKGYIRTTGSLFWGTVILVYGTSHAAYLFILPAASGGPAGPVGWFLFLTILTESNDIYQSIIGRLFGKHHPHLITPTVSPKKTWEGFLGGLLVTLLLALLLAPWLTGLGTTAGPFSLSSAARPWVGPALAGVLIAVAGFFGDINMSAIKRDAGAKDSGHLLPGMGGIIDRIDSLTLSAPVFVYFLLWWMN